MLMMMQYQSLFCCIITMRIPNQNFLLHFVHNCIRDCCVRAAMASKWIQYLEVHVKKGIRVTKLQHCPTQRQIDNHLIPWQTLKSVVWRNNEQKIASFLHTGNVIVIQQQRRCFIACITYRLFLVNVIIAQSIFCCFCVIQVQKKQAIAASKIQSFAPGMAVRSSLSIYHAKLQSFNQLFQDSLRGFFMVQIYWK